MFLVFELEPHQECSYDHIAFYDGDSPESHTLGRFCGSKMPHPIVATGNQMYMVFKSDASVQRRGFAATHFTVCGGRLQASLDRKHFYSHSRFGSASYENRTDCDWTIEAQPGYNVHVMFVTFDLEFEQDCAYDYVEVFNGLDSSGQSYGKFCGGHNVSKLSSTFLISKKRPRQSAWVERYVQEIVKLSEMHRSDSHHCIVAYTYHSYVLISKF